METAQEPTKTTRKSYQSSLYSGNSSRTSRVISMDLHMAKGGHSALFGKLHRTTGKQECFLENCNLYSTTGRPECTFWKTADCIGPQEARVHFVNASPVLFESGVVLIRVCLEQGAFCTKVVSFWHGPPYGKRWP